jgi:hypothetical protein
MVERVGIGVRTQQGIVIFRFGWEAPNNGGAADKKPVRGSPAKQDRRGLRL